MSLQDITGEHPFRDLISVDDLLSELDPRLRKDLTLIEGPLQVLPNKIVFAAGDQSRNIYVHRRGWAALFLDGDIKDIVCACPVGPNYIYGLVEALSGNAFMISMTTLTDNEFDVIDRDELLSFIQTNPALSFRLAEILSHLYQLALQTIKSH